MNVRNLLADAFDSAASYRTKTPTIRRTRYGGTSIPKDTKSG